MIGILRRWREGDTFSSNELQMPLPLGMNKYHARGTH